MCRLNVLLNVLSPLDPGISRGVCRWPVSFTRVYTPRNACDRTITRSLQRWVLEFWSESFLVDLTAEVYFFFLIKCMFSYCLASRTWYAFMFFVSVSAEGTQVSSAQFSYCVASRTWYAFLFLVSVSAEGTQVLLPELCLICASRCEFPFFLSEREFVALV